MKYDILLSASRFYHNEGTNINDRGQGHLISGTRPQNQESLEFYCIWFFIIFNI